MQGFLDLAIGMNLNMVCFFVPKRGEKTDIGLSEVAIVDPLVYLGIKIFQLS